MYVSLFELFKVGIGPSSSHTVGPLNAALHFRKNILRNNLNIDKVKVTLYGSLAYTGIGHKTPQAIILGLLGKNASDVKNKEISKISKTEIHSISFNKLKFLFSVKDSIVFNKETKYKYTNPLKFKAYYLDKVIYEEIYYSIGGGFIEINNNSNTGKNTTRNVPYNFNSMEELINICKKNNFNIYNVIYKNELALNTQIDIKKNILDLWNVMNEVIKNGMNEKGKIDNILNVERRANYLYNKLKSKEIYDPLDIMDWVNIYAIASCEENAAGNRIVTAPTNGAAGIIPAVIKYYQKFIKDSSQEGIINFLLTASSIGMLFKNNASISGAEMGCQGEVGVACSMAAGGLTAAMGGTAKQIENAAEIAMEHNLGLTCDPIKGLVQIPCIERNSMGSIKAINASRLALNSNKPQKVSLDDVIKTMNETGKAMSSKYKETALGGLAVNVVEC